MTRSNSSRPGSDGARTDAPALDVFALRESVVDEYRRFATSFTTIHAPDIREQVAAIYAEDRYWPEPLIQVNPSYRRSADVGALVANGVLHPGCADVFRADGQPLVLYKHQEQAVALAAEGESFVVTTGTGSGKSLCFFIPIVSHVLAARRANATRAPSSLAWTVPRHHQLRLVLTLAGCRRRALHDARTVAAPRGRPLEPPRKVP